MGYKDLVIKSVPPEKRVEHCDGDCEWRLPEAAVMLAFAMHLLRRGEAGHVTICPDGEHGKRFQIRSWLEAHGFKRHERTGSTDYGGIYNRGKKRITVYPKSGDGDVTAQIDGQLVIAETKGGIINTRHSGQVSRLCRGLCEAVGQLMVREQNQRQIAVVPRTKNTLALAKRMTRRAKAAGVEIALVDRFGRVSYVS